MIEQTMERTACRDFFISDIRHDRDWAGWIAQQLEQVQWSAPFLLQGLEEVIRSCKLNELAPADWHHLVIAKRKVVLSRSLRRSRNQAPCSAERRESLVAKKRSSLSALQQAEEAWQESERRFQAVWEHASEAMSISTADGIVVAANPAYFQLYGYSPEEVLGNDYALIFPPEQRLWAHELYTYIFQSPTISPSFETSIRRADGTERIVEASYRFLTQHGTRTYMLSIIRDITARKQAEEALRESALKLHIALEVGQMASWTWDLASNTMHWSTDPQGPLGFVLGVEPLTYPTFLELLHLQDRARIERAFSHCLEEGTDFQAEFRVVHPDGAPCWTRMQGHVLADEAGKPTRMIGISMALTQYTHGEARERQRGR